MNNKKQKKINKDFVSNNVIGNNVNNNVNKNVMNLHVIDIGTSDLKPLKVL